MREYLEELSSATFVAIWGVVATIPGKSASLHSSSGQERQEEGGRGVIYLLSQLCCPGSRGCVVTAHVGGLWPPALGPDRMYLFICSLQ